MENNELDFFNQRLTRIEDIQSEQQKLLATVTGKLEVVAETVDSVRDTLEKLNSNTDKTGLLQKLLMGSIIVQSLLHGITTPEAARAAISQIFTTAGGH